MRIQIRIQEVKSINKIELEGFFNEYNFFYSLIYRNFPQHLWKIWLKFLENLSWLMLPTGSGPGSKWSLTRAWIRICMIRNADSQQLWLEDHFWYVKYPVHVLLHLNSQTVYLLYLCVRILQPHDVCGVRQRVLLALHERNFRKVGKVSSEAFLVLHYYTTIKRCRSRTSSGSNRIRIRPLFFKHIWKLFKKFKILIYKKTIVKAHLKTLWRVLTGTQLIFTSSLIEV